jgi:hypothetical protein
MPLNITVYSVTMASGGTLSSEINLAKSWRRAYIDVTGANSEVRFQAATESGGTFRQVYHPTINSATVANSIFKIPSATSGGMTEIPAGLQFLKVETTAAVANGNTFKIICSD